MTHPLTGAKYHATLCDDSGKRDVCATTKPHRHCVCGLPMEQSAELCGLCLAEDMSPTETYPSYRGRRLSSHNADCYQALARCIGGEEPGRVLTSLFQLRRAGLDKSA